MDLSEEQMNSLRAKLYEELKTKVIEDIKTDEEKRRDALLREREEAKKNRDAYVLAMKESTDPWVDILGGVQTDEGIKIELDWNDAFVKYLRANGISGAKDEVIVQKWVTLLLRDMADDMEGALPETRSASEYA